MRWDLLGFNTIPSIGVLVRAEPLLHPKDPEPLLAELAEDGRTQRVRLADAQAVLDRIAQGCLPGDDELAGAPVIDSWSLLVEQGGASLLGRVEGHPRIGSGRLTATSALIALDGRFGLWARTVSRYYRLGRPVNAELAS